MLAGGAGGGGGKEKRVLLVGPASSGKSVLVRRMKAGAAAVVALQSSPTVGVELDRVPHAGHVLAVREVGSAMKATWTSYVDRADTIVFTLDSTNRPQLAEAAVELLALLAHEEVRQRRVPLLVVLTKCDVSRRLSRAELQSLVRLDDVVASSNTHASGHAHRVRVHEVSACTGAGVAALLANLAQV